MKTGIRKTKIIGTIGPASDSEEKFKSLVEAGLNVARINFSHGGYDENKEKIEMIKKVRKELNQPIAILLDTKGPEIRTGIQESGDKKVKITVGQTFTFVNEDIVGNNERTSITYKELYKTMHPGTKILVDDGALEFEVVEIKDKDIVCKALNTAKLGSRKTVNVPGVMLDLPAITEEDTYDITNGVKAGVDFIAASFVRRVDDVNKIRELLKSVGGEKVKIIAKIENQEGIDNFEEILEAADGIMVARGDMGVEIPIEEVPIVQKDFIKGCIDDSKPSITATQMLESMITNPRPTRAEVSDVANAVFDRTGAIMLSGECALGSYSVECVKIMDKIAVTIEESINYWKRFKRKVHKIDADDLETDIAYIAGITANHMKADAVVAYTHKGDSIRKLSGFGLGCPVFAIADDIQTYYQLALTWGVTPLYVNGENMTIEDKISEGIRILKEQSVLETGDLVVLSGGAKILPKEGENKVIGGFVRI